MNACFIKLNKNMRLILQNQNKNDILEAFKTPTFHNKGVDDKDLNMSGS
jgi:hypothetical protein